MVHQVSESSLNDHKYRICTQSCFYHIIWRCARVVEWQTRRSQKPIPLVCGFESHPGHQSLSRDRTTGPFYFYLRRRTAWQSTQLPRIPPPPERFAPTRPADAMRALLHPVLPLRPFRPMHPAPSAAATPPAPPAVLQRQLPPAPHPQVRGTPVTQRRKGPRAKYPHVPSAHRPPAMPVTRHPSPQPRQSPRPPRNPSPSTHPPRSPPQLTAACAPPASWACP